MANILYNTIDRRYWYYQPNTTRWRHRFRGTRESLKLNQEIAQVAYDIRRIYDQDAINTQTINDLIDHLVSGWNLNGQVRYNWAYDATPFDAPASLMGTEEMASRIEKMRAKLKDMEND